MSWSVLVVDDEPLTQDLLRLMLEPAGFRVTGAEHGLEALQKVQQSKPDIMILDVMMPHMDGLTVCRKIRSNPETADLPIVMLSGKTHLNAVEEGMEAGANRYLAKPMSRNDLIQSLREVLAETTGVRG
ncbi:MAG: response regulator [Ardenticatenaceae bacterium]|nr:response regulator [Anaerolineales bacterium]MCB8980998.1 response regulator [Ardenticatenaceae bacterium]